MDVIKTNLLTKKYKNLTAVDGLSIHVKKGEIYGFLGLNGAGKTTTIRILLGMIKASSGDFSILGNSIRSKEMDWNNIGYMVETAYSYPNLSVFENLEIYARLRNLSLNSINDIIEQLQLSRYRDIRTQNLSLGNKQRLGLAKALIHKPDLLILDEPVNGLDPQGIVEVRNLLKGLVAQGTTVFLSSHILSEIAKLATRIGIIHHGKLIRELYSSELEKELIRILQIRTVDNKTAAQILKKAGYHIDEDKEGIIETNDVKALEQPDKIAELLVKNNLAPRHLFIFVEDLEHYFLRIINSENS